MKVLKVWFRTCFLVLVACGWAATPASAGFIMNEFNGNLFGDAYSALFTISDTSDPDVFFAKLTNTSPDDGFGDEPLLDLLAFNVLDGFEFGVDFDIENISPAWTASAGSGGDDFDVILKRVAPGDRLGFGDMLTFDIVFLDGTAPGFGVFLNAEVDHGTGLGDGSDLGQKAVSFQQLGEDGEESDLLADNWEPPVVITNVAEPSSLLLMGSGLLVLSLFVRRRNRKQNRHG